MPRVVPIAPTGIVFLLFLSSLVTQSAKAAGLRQGGYAATKVAATSSSNPSPPADSIRPLFPLFDGIFLRFGLELYLGAGVMDDLSKVQSPPDSFPFPPGNTTLKALQFRGRVYCGPVGGLAFVDRCVKPVYTHLDSHGLPYGAGSTSAQLLLSLYLDFWGNRLHMEPLYGYGWVTDDARIGDPGSAPYDARSKVRGTVLGWEQIVRLGKSFQVRGIYTYGRYQVSDKRLKLEIQSSTQAASKGVTEEKAKKYRGISMSLGLHQVWRGDGRKERIVYLGAGVLIG